MIDFELDRDRGILIVRPQGKLTAHDFESLTREVDPYIAERGNLGGLLIEAPSFPGWESFGAFVQHLKFVRDHHRRIDRVAAVTDSTFLQIAPKIAEHFANPEIRVFHDGERERALQWLARAESGDATE